MRLSLPTHVHAVAIDADIVFLDVLADTYFCLAGAGAHMRLIGQGEVELATGEAAAALVEAGLLTQAATRRPAPPPALPRSNLSARPARLTPRRLAKAISANARAAEAVGNLPFSELLDLAVGAAPPSPPPASSAGPWPSAASGALHAETRRFLRIAPWLPKNGVCLMRSLQALLYLRACGLAAQWVFGVRTWPFQAHCWLQADDHVLDDHVEHVCAFAPILAV